MAKESKATHYSEEGDLYEILPAIIKELNALKN